MKKGACMLVICYYALLPCKIYDADTNRFLQAKWYKRGVYMLCQQLLVLPSSSFYYKICIKTLTPPQLPGEKYTKTLLIIYNPTRIFAVSWLSNFQMSISISELHSVNKFSHTVTTLCLHCFYFEILSSLLQYDYGTHYMYHSVTVTF